MMVNKLLVFSVFLVQFVVGQTNVGCFVPGECIRSFYVDVTATDYPEECLDTCVVIFVQIGTI